MRIQANTERRQALCSVRFRYLCRALSPWFPPLFVGHHAKTTQLLVSWTRRHHTPTTAAAINAALALGGEQPWKPQSKKYWIRKSMRRPERNKNEGIRINIEQRYFLEDSFSKQGKPRVCSKDWNKVLPRKSGLCFYLPTSSSICKASAQPALLGHAFHLWGVRRFPCLSYYINCLFTAVVQQQEVILSFAPLFMSWSRGLAPRLMPACFVPPDIYVGAFHPHFLHYKFLINTCILQHSKILLATLWSHETLEHKLSQISALFTGTHHPDEWRWSD